MAVNRQDYLNILEQSASRVPFWARSTNPIVRRHLGLNWRTIPPEIRPFVTGYAAWAVVFAVGMVLPFVHLVTATLVIASMILLPFVALLYAHVLVSIAITAADAMQEEMRHDTLSLLRTTPMSLEQIFLGKIAVALWKRMDDLILVAQSVLAFMPPILLSLYAGYWMLDAYPVLSQGVILIGLLAALLRVVLEPLFIGALAVLVSVLVPHRSIALTTTVGLSVFYFVILNMLSHLPAIRGGEKLLDGTVSSPVLPLIFVADFVLPVLLPALLAWLLLRAAVRVVTAD
ncbi:MAG: hypothetical protein MUE40_02490 [Anaerolineae bacterium]|jgi:ABC-type transport system involved in multi-copper enzyme maturation permease subunit|nr:hypothetical protein [Anaerolineae bacterium]